VQCSPGGEEELRGTFQNIFTRNGLYDWARRTLGSQLAIGEGTREPVEEISALVQYIKSASGTYSTVESHVVDTEKNTLSSTRLLNVLFERETQARNYSELGIHADDIGRLQTYALLRDVSGVLGTVTVLPGERLRVEYEITDSIPLQTTYQQSVDGVMYSITQTAAANFGDTYARLPNATNGSAIMQEAPRVVPTVGQPVSGTTLNQAGTTVDGTVSFPVPPHLWNVAAGIQVIQLGRLSGVIVNWHFTPALPKTDTVSMQLTYTTEISNRE